MDVIKVEYIDDVNMKVRCDPGLAQEISDYFTFYVPGHKFTPAFKNKVWDGKIRLFNAYTGLLYVGLLKRLSKFCSDRDYKLELTSEEFNQTNFTIDKAISFVDKLNPTMKPYDYQLNAFTHAITNKRTLLLSPTASGKSFIIYLLARYYATKTLIIVPTTSLVNQMYGDFEDYGFNSEKYVHKIYSGHEKTSDKPIVVSTWQSIYKQPKSYFDEFNLCIGDEAHGFKAKSLTSIMTKLTDCPYKIGLTGTLDGTETNKLVLEGLFGSTHQVITTKELMDKRSVAQLNINAIVLDYPDSDKKVVSKMKYPEEVDFLVSCTERNNFIKNLANKLEGNTLIMFRLVKKHGHVLRDLIKANTDKPVYFVSGSTNADDREEIRRILEKEKNAIAICSDGTFSTGVNVKNLHNIIFSSPAKGRIKVLQSIGRGLRISDTKDSMTLYDIADDLSWKSSKNHTIKHFVERIKLYNEQEFKYKIHKVRIKK